jgi:hypothetical protein
LEEEHYDYLRELGATEAEIADIKSRKFWNNWFGPQGTVWELLNAAGAAVAVTNAGRGSPNSVVRSNRPSPYRIATGRLDPSVVSKRVHGNTAGNQPATLYEKYDSNGNFLKHGVSQNPGKRYTQKEL